MFFSPLNIGALVAIVVTFGQEVSAWSHSGADQWVDDYPNCGGKQQSPININRFNLRYGSFNPILFRNYDVLPTEQTVTNDGHSVKVDITQTSKMPYIEWSFFFFFKTRYNFAQYHFHWGSDSTQGSEHTINSVRYPMEVHLVHFNNKYDDIGTALPESDGLAVLGIFFEISPNDNPTLAPLISAIEEVAGYNSGTTNVVKENLYTLAALLPSNTRRFYRYDGSLTTPTCDESVLWTVFEEPIEISEAQMLVFRRVTGPTEFTNNNYRPVQAINGRTVFKSWK